MVVMPDLIRHPHLGVWIPRSSRGMTLHSGKSVSTILNSPIKPALRSPDEVGGQARLGGGG